MISHKIWYTQKNPDFHTAVMNSLVGWKIYTVFLEIAIIWFGLGQWFQILGFGSLPLFTAFICIHAICINTLGFFEVFAHRTLVAGFSQTSWALPTFSRGNCIGFSGGTAYLNLKMKESLALLRKGLFWKIIFLRSHPNKNPKDCIQFSRWPPLRLGSGFFEITCQNSP